MYIYIYISHARLFSLAGTPSSTPNFQSSPTIVSVWNITITDSP